MISRRVALALSPLAFLVGIPLVHGGIPWALSLLGDRHGWAAGRPAMWNLLGLVSIVPSAVLLLWVMVHGLSKAAQVPERMELDWSPKVMLTEGPYALSRNPIYLGELGLWLGFAVLFGSAFVAGGLVVACLVARGLAVREERDLEKAFGEPYRRYRAEVPRWIRAPWG